jgi:hypothetical protein
MGFPKKCGERRDLGTMVGCPGRHGVEKTALGSFCGSLPLPPCRSNWQSGRL